MRQEVFYPYEVNKYTPDESWTLTREEGHWYSFQADFALKSLGKGPGACLVIGSPIFEALELEDAGWTVTYMDVRVPPLLENFIVADASAENEEFSESFSGSFDCISSTCVLCHAGMGRYGEEVTEDADLKILKNIFKFLKKGGKASITFGPICTDFPKKLGNTHRIYTLEFLKREVLKAGFRICDFRILDVVGKKWVREIKHHNHIDRYYLSMLLTKD